MPGNRTTTRVTRKDKVAWAMFEDELHGRCSDLTDDHFDLVKEAFRVEETSADVGESLAPFAGPVLPWVVRLVLEA